jgi:hypothetical protein
MKDDPAKKDTARGHEAPKKSFLSTTSTNGFEAAE